MDHDHDFSPISSARLRDPEAAWSLWLLLPDLADQLWDLHQDDFSRRCAQEWELEQQWQRAEQEAAQDEWEAYAERLSASPPPPRSPSAAVAGLVIDDDDNPF